MTKPNPDHLRLVEPAQEQSLLAGDEGGLLLRTCEAFEQATGWALQYVSSADGLQNPNLVWSAPVDPGVGASLGLIRGGFASPAAVGKKVRLADAVALAETVAQLWTDLSALRGALRTRETELAADVPVIAGRESAECRAERFEAILKAGAEAVDCQAAALYLLDVATTSLKMRASFGLPAERLLEPPRELTGELGDLEALLGHAVVLTDPAMNQYWHCPEPSAAAVCVPVSSPTTPLGTLWVFSDTPRDFSDQETNLVEVVAGRLAAELEREVLLDDARQNRAQQRDLALLAERHSGGLPRMAPLLADWQIVGRLIGSAGGDNPPALSTFFDWFSVDEDSFGLTLGATVDAGASGALVAAQLRSALRAQADTSRTAEEALATAHDVLGSLSAGCQGASAFYGLIPARPQHLSKTNHRRRAADGEIRFAAAGHAHALLVTEQGYYLLCQPRDLLTAPGTPAWAELRGRLNPGDALVVYVAGPGDPRWQRLDAARELLAPQLAGVLPCNAERLAAASAEAIEAAASAAGRTADGALLVIQAR